MNVLYNMWMPIYRKGKSQFGLTQRAMEEFQLRFGHAEKQEQILSAAKRAGAKIPKKK